MPTDLGDWDRAWVLAHAGSWAVVLARVLGMCFTAPGWAVPELDWRFRLVLAGLLSAVLFPVLEGSIVPPADLQSGAWVLLSELVIGGLLGWSTALVIAGARFAGELIAAPAGLSTAALFDPETGGELTVLGSLYGWLALAIFLTLDGPLHLVRALVESYRAFPSGRLLVPRETADLAFAQIGMALALALRAAAPAALALTLTSVVLGWLSRAAPSLPFNAFTLPIRCAMGIVLVSLSLFALVVAVATALESLPF
jgi:flagellar biosynthesis protein FliR